jgi:hypothetical protein
MCNESDVYSLLSVRTRPILGILDIFVLKKNLVVTVLEYPKTFGFDVAEGRTVDQNLLRITNPVSDLTGDQYM